MNGILLINKPEDFTSFDVIAKLRGILKIRRLGHTGTLDPMATGVLPVLVGKATRACDIIPSDEKSYTAGFTLGFTTDTQDITGNILSRSDKKISKDNVLNILEQFKGTIEQIPPMYSAVSVDGKRLYDLARQGIEVERKPRKITIKEIKLLQFDEMHQQGTLFIHCTKGTYIRTIINDIGELLGCGACMNSLVRNSSSGFKLENCLTLDEVKQYALNSTIESKIIPVDKAFKVYPEIVLDNEQTQKYKNGVKLDANRLNVSSDSSQYRIYSDEYSFLGLAKITESNELKSIKNFY